MNARDGQDDRGDGGTDELCETLTRDNISTTGNECKFEDPFVCGGNTDFCTPYNAMAKTIMGGGRLH